MLRRRNPRRSEITRPFTQLLPKGESECNGMYRRAILSRLKWEAPVVGLECFDERAEFHLPCPG